MDLKKNAPKGEFLAYINKEEAAMLKKAGGSGKLVNGIPSFRPEDYGQEARSKEKGFDQSDLSNPYSDASQSKQAAENKAIAGGNIFIPKVFGYISKTFIPVFFMNYI